MTVRNLDAEYSFDDPDDGWFGAESAAPSSTPTPSPQPLPDEYPSPPIEPRHTLDPAEDTDRWLVQDMNLASPVELEDPPSAAIAAYPEEERPAAESVLATIAVVPTRRNGFVRASAPSSWESRLSTSGAWEFKATSDNAWYRSRAVLAAAAIIVAVVAIFGIVVALRSPGDESAPRESVAPPSTSMPSVPSASLPVASSVAPLPPPPPPPGLPPPPPPSAEELKPPAPRQYSPSYQTPDTPKKPQTNVTRAPLSATPPPPPRETDRGRATPGQSGSHGFFG